MTNQLTFQNFVQTRNTNRNVVVVNPQHPWQQVGRVEWLKDDGTVFIRWHNGDLDSAWAFRPTSIHNIDDVSIL